MDKNTRTKCLKLEIGGNYFDGEGFLFAGFSCNGLFYWNVLENTISILGSFDEELIWSKWMSYVAIKKENNIFFLPYMAHGIPYFDLNEKKINYCEIPFGLKNKYLNYFGYIVKENFIYMFPINPLEAVLVLDMEGKKVTNAFGDWNKNILNYFQKGEPPLMSGFHCVENRIWISYDHLQGIIELSFYTWDVKFYTWEEITHPIILKTDDDGFWLEDKGKARVFHIDDSGHIIERYEIQLEEECKDKQLFSSVAKLKKGERLVLPSFSNLILIIDRDKQVHLKRISDEGQFLCYYYLEREEEVWLLPHSQNDIIVLDLCNYKIRYNELPMPEVWLEISDFILKMRDCESNYIIEEEEGGISQRDFCDYMIHKETDNNEKNNGSNFGEKIWKSVSKYERSE